MQGSSQNLKGGSIYEKNLYSTRLVKIPEPVFVVFYNGKEKMPERSVLRLSDAYEQPSGDPVLELKVLVLNINPGYNKELMENCKKLRDYSIFTNKIREYNKLLHLINLIKKKRARGLSADEIADFLEEDVSRVQELAALADSHPEKSIGRYIAAEIRKFCPKNR